MKNTQQNNAFVHSHISHISHCPTRSFAYFVSIRILSRSLKEITSEAHSSVFLLKITYFKRLENNATLFGFNNIIRTKSILQCSSHFLAHRISQTLCFIELDRWWILSECKSHSWFESFIGFHWLKRVCICAVRAVYRLWSIHTQCLFIFETKKSSIQIEWRQIENRKIFLRSLKP